MDKRERLHAALNGESVDRIPVALWRHFPVDDQRPTDLAMATVEWQAAYDFDFVKVTPASSFCIKDWGADDEWRGNPEGTRDYTRRVIHRPDDWYTLNTLDPTQGRLGDQLRALDLIRSGLPKDTPFIQTIFSPISQAKNLTGADNLTVHLREHPDELKAGLETITDTTLRFVEAAARTGLDGIFYAVQLASTRTFSEAEYREFGEPYDRKILESAGGLWLNVLHVHGEPIMFDLAAQYPAQVINWHDRETPPTLAEGKHKVNGAVCGGWRQWETMVLGTPDKVRAEAREAIEATGGRRLILGTGCVTPTTAPRANIRAARDVVDR
ncbi:MAG TPA: uroporphyrinogen decarboxylase family protein [Anaerolineales bacterium]|nr:uroporphyrinogen decarboxylase family protein [Anaerolineales bacterium]